MTVILIKPNEPVKLFENDDVSLTLLQFVNTLKKIRQTDIEINEIY